MPESSPRVDLRLTIPAAAPYREMAVEVAVKFAEYAGASKSVAADVSRAVAAATASPGEAIDVRLSAADGDVSVTINASTD